MSTASALLQIGVFTILGGDDDDIEQHHFAAQAFGQSLDRVFRGCIGRKRGRPDFPLTELIITFAPSGLSAIDQTRGADRMPE
jgi:hypothetical protein